MYSKGIVYKIVCNVDPNICYIGSTFRELETRWSCHKSRFNHWLKGKAKSSTSIFPYFKKYGIENFSIIKIKEYICYRGDNNDHKHLSVYEQLWINKTRCINKANPLSLNVRTNKQKESQKVYFKKNKEKIVT